MIFPHRQKFNSGKIGIILLYLLLFLFCHETPPAIVQIKKITEDVSVFEYLNVNVTVVKSAVGLVIVDTQRSPGTMQTVMKFIKNEFGRDKIAWVINTHGHWDHCSGNQIFPPDIIIGHANCPEYIRRFPANAETNLWSVRKLVTDLKNELVTLPDTSSEFHRLRSEINGRETILHDLENTYNPTVPQTTFTDSLVLSLGDLTVKLYAMGNAHTNNDILVYIPEEKLVITGDLFTSPTYFGFPINQITDIDRMLSVLDRILATPEGVESVITSHTEVLSGEELASARSFIADKYIPFRKNSSAAKLLQTLFAEDSVEHALKKYEKLLSDFPGKYYFLEEEYYTLGRQYLSTGQNQAALAVFQTEVTVFPESALAYDNLGEVYYKTGDIGKAIENYEKSLEISPYNLNAVEMLKILRKKN